MASAHDLALVQGIAHTRATLRRWNGEPWPVLRTWTLGAIAICAALLTAVLVIASLVEPDPTPIDLPGLTSAADGAAVAEVIKRNALVLALHGFACVAGFIAGSSLPAEAERHSGLTRRIHDHAGPMAIGFVVLATSFSLVTQAWVLGHAASTLAAQGSMAPALLLLGLAPHAIPELVALFLPLAAWIVASRRGAWEELLAATVVTCTIAFPILVASAFVETYLSPPFILFLRS